MIILKFNESMLKTYAAPLSESENTKCRHAIEEIRDALKELGYENEKEISPLESGTFSYSVSMKKRYSSERVNIFIQGSYANNTCIRNESDVDVAVVRDDINEYAFNDIFNFIPRKRNSAIEFKNTVEATLRNKFPLQVHRGDKSIKIDGNTYRKQSDVVPCLSMHYHNQPDNFLLYQDGVTIFSDSGEIIVNFPKQHISNGKAKNNRTNHYYKKMVRIIKKMRHIMSDAGLSCASDVSSFGLESLIWNIPDSNFMKYTSLGFSFQNIVSYLYTHKNELPFYYEANGIKKLCPTQQDTTKYTSFINSLRNFYEYDYRS